METFERRALLACAPNPAVHRDYIVSLTGQLPGITVKIHYVPDREIIMRDSLIRYLQAIERLDWTGIESIGVTVMEDFFDVSIARWTMVTLQQTDDDAAIEFMAEDRQPNWNNTRLLERLR
tara:strand:+ start:143 stop:505 length:363 start_codon:yes stop_codon:yes gene_type:complete